jgi:hypothetical protein
MQDEALVEAVLRRNDEEGVALNPFDLDATAAYSTEAVGPEDLELTLRLSMEGLLPSAAAAGPDHGPGSMPLGGSQALERHSRPTSASMEDTSSSPGPSRPGTAGPRSGLSALAAAALHGHPALRAAAGAGPGAAGPGALPSRVYEDPRWAARALRAINARLAAFEAEHVWDEDGGLADFKAAQPRTRPDAAALPAVSGATDGPAPPVRPASPTRSVAASGQSQAAASVTATGHKDYLREERLAKELASRWGLHTGQPPHVMRIPSGSHARSWGYAYLCPACPSFQGAERGRGTAQPQGGRGGAPGRGVTQGAGGAVPLAAGEACCGRACRRRLLALLRASWA